MATLSIYDTFGYNSFICQQYYDVIMNHVILIVMPGRPENVTVDDVMINSLRLTWQPVEGDNVARYIIQYRLSANPGWDNAAELNVSSDVTSIDITDLLPFMTYEVRVLAVSSAGVTSIASEQATVTTQG